ncbi:hypothetical protein XELAEV_18010377mg [Xenopus laevis]|uniref:Uncharacterized protein n=1 Tax=Xenopus laevis TaxID=8355 RepID=A0A974I196_XENLA|nr:hypothetical protein XELAEV_18010377mg [Xenopus laevis]
MRHRQHSGEMWIFYSSCSASYFSYYFVGADYYHPASSYNAGKKGTSLKGFILHLPGLAICEFWQMPEGLL